MNGRSKRSQIINLRDKPRIEKETTMNLFSDGMTLSEFTLFSDGMTLSEFTLFSDGMTLSEGHLLGD
jgi:hypothetical protein